MNNAASALASLQEFLSSSERMVVLDGTHQHRKHVLALAMLLESKERNLRILFRCNSSRNASDFLRPLGIAKLPSGGGCVSYHGHRLFVDTINPRSWAKSPNAIDVAVVYPLDSLNADEGSRCIEDLERRHAEKIFLVTWTDSFDMTWVRAHSPRWVTYDAAEEDPAYDARVRKFTDAPRTPTLKTPGYAAHADPRYLVRLFCDRCGAGRWALLDKPYPGIALLRDAEFGEYEAKCLMCGSIMSDNYNWYGQS